MNRKRILIVDDSRTALMMTSVIVSKGPYEVLTANDGLDGVAKALREKPDLILMDVMMPKMDGFEAVKRLRDEEPTRSTPIIMVTTRGENENLQLGYESGCSDYVTKPINSVELMAKIRDHLAA